MTMLTRFLQRLGRKFLREKADYSLDAWEDYLITGWEYHQMNEDMLLPGDPPYWPDDLWGEPHSHQAPQTCFPPDVQREVFAPTRSSGRRPR